MMKLRMHISYHLEMLGWVLRSLDLILCGTTVHPHLLPGILMNRVVDLPNHAFRLIFSVVCENGMIQLVKSIPDMFAKTVLSRNLQVSRQDNLSVSLAINQVFSPQDNQVFNQLLSRQVSQVFSQMLSPSSQPSARPSAQSSRQPSVQPSRQPSVQPIAQPSSQPSFQPNVQPSSQPSARPSAQPSRQPSVQPSRQPSAQPIAQPSNLPSFQPNVQPSSQPSARPSAQPSSQPSFQPSSAQPSSQPSARPSAQPSSQPSFRPSSQPSAQPSRQPSAQPSAQPSNQPSFQPNAQPSRQPSARPSAQSSSQPSRQPSAKPSAQLSKQPTNQPSAQPSRHPNAQPSSQPRVQLSAQPSKYPSHQPLARPFSRPSIQPSCQPTEQPSLLPSLQPNPNPTKVPSRQPSAGPSIHPSSQPTEQPTTCPTQQPMIQPSASPSSQPSSQPSSHPALAPTQQPLIRPSSQPCIQPSMSLPATQPSQQPSLQPSVRPTLVSSRQPHSQPSNQLSNISSQQPSSQQSRQLTKPSFSPSAQQPSTNHPTAELVFPSHGLIEPISVIFSSGYQTQFRIVLPFMFANIVAGDGLFDVVMTRSLVNERMLLFGSKQISTVVTSHDYVVIADAIGYDYSGRSVSNAGDVNGDGYDDLIIGVPYAARCYVLFGTHHGFVNMLEGFTILGADLADLTGWSVSGAGDVNNDTFADLIIGVPNDGIENRGAVYVIYGNYTSSNLDLSVPIKQTHGFVVHGTDNQDCLGIAVSSLGDVNGDAIEDIVVSALRMHEFFSGAVYVIFGRAFHAVQPRAVSVSIVGTMWSWFGYSLCNAGDVNGDGINDVLIGSVPRKVYVGSPVSYIIFGNNSGVFPNSTASISAEEGMKIEEGGSFVSGVGDVDGDGYDDVLLDRNIGFDSGGGIVITHPFVYPKRTSSPSILPTTNPSNLPSRSPTALPSRTPTRPTMTPTDAPSGPTELPTMTPSQPTSMPSAKPTAPTLVPSDTPTVTPSHHPSTTPTVPETLVPTLIPSMSPSEQLTYTPSTMLPTVTPTVVITMQPSRLPVSYPTIIPTSSALPTFTPTSHTNVSYSVVHVARGGTYQRRLNNTHFIINSTSNIIIDGIGGGVLFTVLLNRNTTLLIRRFVARLDRINIAAFLHIQSYSQLLVRGRETTSHHRVLQGGDVSTVFNLGDGQSIVLANITLSELTENNFIFASITLFVPAIGTMKRSYGAVIVLCTVFGSLGLLLFYKFGEQVSNHLQIKRLKARVTDWDSDMVRKNPTYVSFHINDSDRSIFSEISSDSEGSSIELSSESRATTIESNAATPNNEVSSTGMSDKLSSSDSDHSRGHRARHGRDMLDYIVDDIMQRNDIHYAPSKDDSGDFTLNGLSDYKSSSEEEGSEVIMRNSNRKDAYQYHENNREMLLEHMQVRDYRYLSEVPQYSHSASNWWKQTPAVHYDQEYYHNEEYQEQQQEYVYRQYADDRSNQDVGDYDVEANSYNYSYQQQQHHPYDQSI